MKKLNLINQHFGKLLAVKNLGSKATGQSKKIRCFWKCLCDCGNETIVSSSHLTSGHTKSCGCLLKKTIIERNKSKEMRQKVSKTLKKIYEDPKNHPCYIDGRWSDREFQNQLQRQWKYNNKGKVNAMTAKRRAAKLQATPSWADLNYIESIYKICSDMNQRAGRTLFHVDHEIPLQGKIVCGLHVENNLQILLASENLYKNNTFGTRTREVIKGMSVKR